MKKRKDAQREKNNLILINVHSSYIRVAQLRDGMLSDFHLEKISKPSQVGAIYKAQVSKKQAGLEACFVNIDSEKSAFLYTGKRAYETLDLLGEAGESENRGTDREDKFSLGSQNISDKKKDNPLKKLRRGQTLMVQVIKDPLKGKSFRVSDKISLPGIYLVYLPNSPFHIGVSRQIEDEKQRERLIHSVQKWNKKEAALIIRTKALEANEEDLKQDWDSLKETWKNILKKYKAQKMPGLVWSDIPVSFKILRDFLTDDVDRVWVDDEILYSRLREFIEKYTPGEKHKIFFYNNKELSLFDKYDLEPELKKLLQKKVRLPSGGMIVIEETEAAVVVDVNTGRFMGKKPPEENILKINMEAAREIALQIRLRNCGGIILIDFIDMGTDRARQKVMEELNQELEKDKTPTRLCPISEFGVAQLTRKRTQASLLETMCEPCPYCEGQAYIVKSENTGT